MVLEIIATKNGRKNIYLIGCLFKLQLEGKKIRVVLTSILGALVNESKKKNFVILEIVQFIFLKLLTTQTSR
jgi:hypothetical protein